MNGVKIGEEVTTNLGDEISSKLLSEDLVVGNSREEIELFCEKFIPLAVDNLDSLDNLLNLFKVLKKNIKTDIDFPRFAEDMNKSLSDMEGLLATDSYYNVENNNDAKLFQARLDAIKEKFSFANSYFDALNKYNEVQENCKKLEKKYDEASHNESLNDIDRTTQLCSIMANLVVERKKITKVENNVNEKLNELYKSLNDVDVSSYMDELLNSIIDLERSCWTLTLDEKVKENIGKLISSARDTVVLLGDKKAIDEYYKACKNYGIRPKEQIKLKFVIAGHELLEEKNELKTVVESNDLVEDVKETNQEPVVPDVEIPEVGPTLEDIFNTKLDQELEQVTPEESKTISVDDLCSDLVKLNPTVKFQLLYNNLTIDTPVSELKVPDYSTLEGNTLTVGKMVLNLISEKKEKENVNFVLPEEHVEEPVFTYDEKTVDTPVEESVETSVQEETTEEPDLEDLSEVQEELKERKRVTNARNATINRHAKGAIKLGATADIVSQVKDKETLKSTGVFGGIKDSLSNLKRKMKNIGVNTSKVDDQNINTDTEENVHKFGDRAKKAANALMDGLKDLFALKDSSDEIDDMYNGLNEQMKSLNEAKQAGVDAINEMNNQDFFGEELQGGR